MISLILINLNLYRTASALCMCSSATLYTSLWYPWNIFQFLVLEFFDLHSQHIWKEQSRARWEWKSSAPTETERNSEAAQILFHFQSINDSCVSKTFFFYLWESRNWFLIFFPRRFSGRKVPSRRWYISKSGNRLGFFTPKNFFDVVEWNHEKLFAIPGESSKLFLSAPSHLRSSAQSLPLKR